LGDHSAHMRLAESVQGGHFGVDFLGSTGYSPEFIDLGVEGRQCCVISDSGFIFAVI